MCFPRKWFKSWEIFFVFGQCSMEIEWTYINDNCWQHAEHITPNIHHGTSIPWALETWFSQFRRLAFRAIVPLQAQLNCAYMGILQGHVGLCPVEPRPMVYGMVRFRHGSGSTRWKLINHMWNYKQIREVGRDCVWLCFCGQFQTLVFYEVLCFRGNDWWWCRRGKTVKGR